MNAKNIGHQPGMEKVLNAGYVEALVRVPEALQREGFGVLSEIDVAQTLQKKIGVDFRRYKILGACNPPFAHRALTADLRAGLMMPCNVIVFENDAGTATVLAVDPVQSAAALGEPALQELAAEIRDKLQNVLDTLE